MEEEEIGEGRGERERRRGGDGRRKEGRSLGYSDS